MQTFVLMRLLLVEGSQFGQGDNLEEVSFYRYLDSMLTSDNAFDASRDHSQTGLR